MASAFKRPGKQPEEENEEEFKDDFEDEEFDEEKASKKSLKKVVEKDDYDEEEEEEKAEFEEERPKPKGRPVGSFKKPQTQSSEQMEEKYSPYHITERIGVKDNKTNTTIGEDVYTILASIKNDLHELKVGLLGEK